MATTTAIAASAGVSIPMRGSRSNDSKKPEPRGLTSVPPSTVPRMIDITVKPSIQPLAGTSFSGGSSSVRMPYLAGEYTAAPKPTTAYEINGCTVKNISAQPNTLMMFAMNITRPLLSASAKAPTNAASNT
jgi:hypothetical protein